MPKLPPNSILILLIVTETHVWQRRSNSKPNQKPFEPRPVRTVSINEVLTPIPELVTQVPYDESSFWWINPETTGTLEDITALYQYQYDKDFLYHIHLEKSNSIWYTQYPESNQHSSQGFEIPAV